MTTEDWTSNDLGLENIREHCIDPDRFLPGESCMDRFQTMDGEFFMD